MITITHCDLCGSEQFERLFSQTDFVYHTTDEYFSYVQCTNCGLIFLNPRPDVEEMGKYYPNSYSFYRSGKMGRIKEFIKKALFGIYYDHEIKNYINIPLKIIVYPFFLLMRCWGVTENIRYYRKYPYLDKHQGRRILDVGCGSGTSFHPFEERYSMLWLNQRGYNCEGVEVDSRACSIAAMRGLKVFQGYFDKVDLQEEAYDVVRMNYSLEHVDVPSDYFKRAHSVLKRGGELIVSVPNYDGVVYQLFPDAVEVPRHLYYFNKKSLTDYFIKFGFEIQSVSTDPTPEVFKYVVEHNPETQSEKLCHRKKIKVFDLLPFYDIAAEKGFGDDITVIGVKR